MWKKAVGIRSGERDIDVLVGNVQRSVLNRDTLDGVRLCTGFDAVKFFLVGRTHHAGISADTRRRSDRYLYGLLGRYNNAVSVLADAIDEFNTGTASRRIGHCGLLWLEVASLVTAVGQVSVVVQAGEVTVGCVGNLVGLPVQVLLVDAERLPGIIVENVRPVADRLVHSFLDHVDDVLVRRFQGIHGRKGINHHVASVQPAIH